MRQLESNQKSLKPMRPLVLGQRVLLLVCLMGAAVWAVGGLKSDFGVPVAKASNPRISGAVPASVSAPELPRPFVAEDGERLLPEFVFQEVMKDGSLKEWGFVDLRGRPVVAVSWATWCGVCAKDLPKLQELQRTLSQRRLSRLDPSAQAGEKIQGPAKAAASPLVAALSIDDLAPQKVAAHLNKRGLGELRTFYDSNKMFFLTTSGVGVPSAIIADREGRIVARAQGSVDWQDPKLLVFIESLSD